MVEKVKEIVVYVSFDFGAWAYVGVDIYEGKTLEECLRLRSKRIDGYIQDGKYIKIKGVTEEES